MMEFLKKIFDSDLMSHGHCYLWKPEIVWLHVVSDVLITLAYFSIPVILVYFVRKRSDLPFNWMFLMFGAFIYTSRQPAPATWSAESRDAWRVCARCG